MTKQTTDIVLIGAGIMSATLGTFLKNLNKDYKISVFEKMDVAATESSDAWNNAGTGHSAFCELNYTPEKVDGSIDVSKALKIAEQFEISKQFWSYLVSKNLICNPQQFINKVPHCSFVWGENNVSFLEKRYKALTKNVLFEDMEFSNNTNVITSWMPLVMQNREPQEPVAATKMAIGTDVNFGTLTREMFGYLQKQKDVSIHFNHKVTNLKKLDSGLWEVTVYDALEDSEKIVQTNFVFIGAGGASIHLLEKANIPEGEGYGGFPVSGQWLRCTNQEVIEKHHAKVYGKATVGSPPMSVPHIDSRIINGKKELLFGPYAGFTTKFLKHGSYLDLLKSIKIDNIKPMLSAGWHNIPLTKYLIDQVIQTPEERFENLLEYVPSAQFNDWVLEEAGQRVQVIKEDKNGVGVLEFGTEVINTADGSLAVLLGASPGASTAVSIMLEVLQKCFPSQINSVAWQEKLLEMIPSYASSLQNDKELVQKIRKYTSQTLKLV